MARTLTRNSRSYGAGVYGPFNIDQFTNADSTGVEVLMTVENWPVVETVCVITVTLGDGTVLTVNVPGQPKNRDGTPATTFRCAVDIPVMVEGETRSKRDVRNATASFEVLQTFRTALTVRAY